MACPEGGKADWRPEGLATFRANPGRQAAQTGLFQPVAVVRADLFCYRFGPVLHFQTVFIRQPEVSVFCAGLFFCPCLCRFMSPLVRQGLIGGDVLVSVSIDF